MRKKARTRTNVWEHPTQPQNQRQQSARPHLHPLVSAARIGLVLLGLVALLAPLTDQIDLAAYHTATTAVGCMLGLISITMLIIALRKRTRRAPYLISWLTSILGVAALFIPLTNITVNGYENFMLGLGVAIVALGLLVPFICRVISAERHRRAGADTRTETLPTQQQP